MNYTDKQLRKFHKASVTECKPPREIFGGFNSSRPTMKPNYIEITPTKLEFTEENVELFNNVYRYCLVNNFHEIVRTKSGGICKKRGVLKFPAYDVVKTGTKIIITVLGFRNYRIMLSSAGDVENEYTKNSNWKKIWYEMCKRFDISMRDYAIEDGMEVRKEVPKYLTDTPRKSYYNITYRNVNHIDFHSAFPGGLIETHPEFEPVVRTLYEKKELLKTENSEESSLYKLVLNAIIGYFWSKQIKAKYANLAKDAITRSNDKLLELSDRLQKAGRVVLLFNTDGIWYGGDEYHGDGEGKDIGEWSNDHVNCKFRMKSSGAYEYEENGVYHPVVKGRTNLDKVLPREQWKWGYIYRKGLKVLVYDFVENVGVIMREVDV